MDGTRERRNRRPGVAVATPRGWYQFSAGKTEITTEYYWPLWLLNQIFLVSSNTVVDTRTANGDDGGDGEIGEWRKRFHRWVWGDEDDDNDVGRRKIRRRGRRASDDVARKRRAGENRRRSRRTAPPPRERRKEEARLSTWRRKKRKSGGGWNALM